METLIAYQLVSVRMSEIVTGKDADVFGLYTNLSDAVRVLKNKGFSPSDIRIRAIHLDGSQLVPEERYSIKFEQILGNITVVREKWLSLEQITSQTLES